MSWFWRLNLIHCLDWYLLLIFLVGTGLRVNRYRSLLALIWSMPGRWPLLLGQVKQHHGLFLTRATVLPALMAFLLFLTHTLACRLVWPEAGVTAAQLAQWLSAVLVVGSLGAGMVGLDCYGALRVGEWDPDRVEAQLSRAEFWLGSPASPVVRVLTLGIINPRKRVADEIHNGLAVASGRLNTSLWAASLRTGFRIAFGAALWLTFLWSPL
jgi:hypothetical protein